jgi:hypothetical protein
MAVKNTKTKTSKKIKTNKRMKKNGNKRRTNKAKTLRRKKMLGGTSNTYDFATMNQVGKLYNDMNFQKSNTFEISPNPLSNLA